jgi:hypothetical protein
MTSAKAIPSNARRFAFTAFAAIVLASAPSFVFAQRSGGHGGGGGGAHSGGGGVHSAGGFSGSSGRSTGGGPSAGSSARGSYRAAPSAPTYSRPSSSYARPGANSYRSAPAPYSGSRDAYRAPAGNRGTASVRGGAPGAPASHVGLSDGQWHSFRPSTSTQASGSSRSTNSGIVRTPRTFVGQGHDLYEEGPRTGGASAAARPGTMGSASRTVSSSSRASSPVASTAFASHSLLASNRSFGGRTFGPAGFAGAASREGRFSTFGLRPVGLPFVRPGFGFGFGLRPGFGFGLGPVFRPFGFGFGRFGLGFGFGFGWNPCWGAVWDPFCFGGFSGPAYGYYGYPPPYDQPYDPSYDPNAYPPQTLGSDPNYDPGNQSGGPPPDSQSSAPSEPVNPNWDTTVNAGIAAQPGSVIIYLKDGTSLSPSDYWITDDQLHYTLGGSENTVGMDHVDLRRTNDENAKNGVRFWLKSEPEKSPASSGDAPAASPTPEPNDNATPGPASTPPNSEPPKDAPSAEPL